MLIKCNECGLPVSDKALMCPHCGNPLKTRNINKIITGHRRLPNGFGQISEIKTQYLREPFRAMVTVGKDEYGRPICKLLHPKAYFKTYNEAYEALVKYHTEPQNTLGIETVEDLYEKWSEQHYRTITPATIETFEWAWNNCQDIAKMRIRDVKATHLRDLFEKDLSVYLIKRMKILLNMMWDYAMEYEIVEKNIPRMLKLHIEEEETKHHDSFTDEEMQILWDHKDDLDVGMILVQCYMGWRPQEMGLITQKNVNIYNWSIIGGMKTKAGTNRLVPIHKCIREIILIHYRKSATLGSEYLFTGYNGKFMSYNSYNYIFNKTMKKYHLDSHHRPHDPRVQFVSMCKRYNVNEYAIKHMAGHEIRDITESLYTVRPVEWYHEEISKIIVNKL